MKLIKHHTGLNTPAGRSRWSSVAVCSTSVRQRFKHSSSAGRWASLSHFHIMVNKVKWISICLTMPDKQFTNLKTLFCLQMTPNPVPTLMSHLQPLTSSQYLCWTLQTQSVPSCLLSTHLCQLVPPPPLPWVHPLQIQRQLVFLTPRPQHLAHLQESQRKRKPRSFSTAPCAK